MRKVVFWDPFLGPLFHVKTMKFMKNHVVPCGAQRRGPVKTPKSGKTAKTPEMTVPARTHALSRGQWGVQTVGKHHLFGKTQ